MAFFELYDESGDTGMLVVGQGVGQSFQLEAEEAGRTDEALVTVRSVELLLEREELTTAARGICRRLDISAPDSDL